ncbi:MAG: PAS domain S-box-containing protein [Bradymonadia bacterium]
MTVTRERRLLDMLHKVQAEFLFDDDRGRAFDGLLRHVLDATGSEYGFIAEVLHAPDGAPYLKTHAITNIAWNEETRRLYAKSFAAGLEFRNLDTLFGQVMTTQQVVIANDPASDPRRGGLPKGHPPLDAFLGIPFHAGPEMVGMVGVANRVGGYDAAVVNDCDPLLATCASLVIRHRAEQRRLTAEALLTDSEARLKAVLAESLDAVVSMTSDGRVDGWNPRAEAMFGWTEEEVIGQDLDALIVPERMRAGHRAGVARHLQTGEARIAGRMVRLSALRRAGDEFPVELIVYSAPAGEGYHYTAFMRDITEHTRIEDDLRGTMSWLGALVENLDAGLLVEDETRHIRLANEKLCQMFGIVVPPELLVGVDCAGALADLAEVFVDPVGFVTSIDVCLADRVPVIAQQHRLRDGRILDRDYVPIIIGTEYRGHFWQYRDVTVQEHAKDALTQRRDALGQANAELARVVRLKDQFLASMSHELRTPLNAILGLSEGLRAHAFGPIDPQVVGAVTDIEDSGRHLLELINDVLDISKAEAGKITLNIQELDADTLCDATVRLLREAARAKQIRLRTNYDPALQTLQADAKRLKQILANLLSNAIKFTHAGGNVWLETEVLPSEDAALIRVRDDGIGIASDDMKHLFEPFVQVDSRLSRAHTGTGLGLSLLHRLVKLHGGSALVDSAVGRGSIFTVRLPWSADSTTAEPLDEAESMSTAIPMARVGAKPRSLLLVDDNKVNVRMMTKYLSRAGYALTIAHNGEEAIRLAHEVLPEVIIMDIQMPVMDGIEATKALRRSEATAGIPIIALTALAMPGDRDRCLAAGVNEYFSKPVGLQQIAAAIERLCEA